jgi:hypothetical protein
VTEYSKLNLLFTCFTFKTVYREKTIKIWLQIEINSTTTLITGEKKMFEKKQKTFQLWLFNYNNEHNKKNVSLHWRQW